MFPKKFSVFTLFFLVIFLLQLFSIRYPLFPVHADEISDLQSQIDSLNKSLQQSQAATKPLEGQLTSLQAQLSQIQAKLNNLSAQINQKEKELAAREEKLTEDMADFDNRVSRDYKDGYSLDPLSQLLGNQGKFSDWLYGLAVISNNRRNIDLISQEITGILTDKAKLESDKGKLASFQAQVDQNAKFIGGEVAKAKAYQADLNNQIASLTAKQQQILAQRLSALGIPLFASAAGSCSSDLTNGKDPGFSGGFGLFTYGVPNRVGLSQYGAFGRARAGQNYSTILSAYYNYDSISDVSQSTTIHVTGNGIDWTGSIEDYVKRIYEVPNSWGDQGGMEALKAQAIAARSYALSYTNNGSSTICPTDQCQVFQTDPKGGNWDQAVSDTAGKVMVQGGSPIKAWFSSTHGGYIHSSGDIGWGGTSWTKNGVDASSSISSFSDLKSNAYDKDSPWFYCDWGSRSDYGGTAWLKGDEIADIVNAILLASADSGTREHLYQTDKGNPAGTDTWDANRVRSELQSRGLHGFSSVSSINVSADFGSGKTSSVTVSGDAGSQSISGDTFKTYFNLRAPGNIQIVGPLYNVERH